jgi:DNA-binding NtrC family response regulator
MVDKVAPTNVTVLITAESGAGKEVIAHAIHRHSQRADRSFETVNCAAIPESLLESVLFGHEKGAFAGATARRIGVLEQASGGTLFLNDIEDIPLDLQSKLLRVLQEQEFKRVGSPISRRADLRVVAGSNSNLAQLVAEQKFRSDLYFRLSVFPITVPPLRERREDIPALAEHFLKMFTVRYMSRVTKISPAALERLYHYDWPGNVRELKHVIERAVLLSSGIEIEPSDLPFLDRSDVRAGLGEVGGSFPSTLERIERKMIENALRRTGGDKTTAATRLGISRTLFYNKLKKYRIVAPRLDSET